MKISSRTTNRTFDATDRKLGRLATEIAVALMGKDRIDFARNRAPDVRVEVTNARKLDLSEKKLRSKVYVRHTGYPGGLRGTPAERVAKAKGYGELVRRAVFGMLPKNKLRRRMIKNLAISE